MAGILVFSENDDTALELVSKGKELKNSSGGKLAALVLGKPSAEKAALLFSYGAQTVYQAQQEVPADSTAVAQAIAQAARTYSMDVILIGSTRIGKEVAAMVAQSLGAGCITDATDIRVKDGEMLIDRYTFGGSTVASANIKSAVKVIAVMPKTFALAPPTPSQGETVAFAPQLTPSGTKLLQTQEKLGESTPIEEAETLLCVGRGLSDKKDIPMIEAMAQAMKAEIGCTRPLTHDWQWFPESREVGLSGKKCKPTLCVSVGISGQIQHTVGIRNSRIIAAINKDKNAPIFKTADYGLVADLYDVVPRLTKKLQALSK
jgi:electron transfer flavoprotein alpha subunit